MKIDDLYTLGLQVEAAKGGWWTIAPAAINDYFRMCVEADGAGENEVFDRLKRGQKITIQDWGDLLLIRAGAARTYLPQTDLIPPTDEMIDFFFCRTAQHISHVQTGIRGLIKAGLAPELFSKYLDHDQTKYQHPECIPYIYLSWFHRLRGEGTEYKYPIGVEEAVKIAIDHHYATNPHHPEFHASPRDMAHEDIVEMVADWNSFGGGEELVSWGEKALERYDFSEPQRASIWGLINHLQTTDGSIGPTKPGKEER